MESVDVFVRRHGVEYLGLWQALRQRKLNEEPVDEIVLVQLIDQGEDLTSRRGRSKTVHPAPHADLGGRLLLVAHVDLGRGVITDQNHVETRWASVGLAKTRDPFRHLTPHLGCDRLSVENPCRHGRASTTGRARRSRRDDSALRAAEVPIRDDDRRREAEPDEL